MNDIDNNHITNKGRVSIVRTSAVYITMVEAIANACGVDINVTNEYDTNMDDFITMSGKKEHIVLVDIGEIDPALNSSFLKVFVCTKLRVLQT